MACNGFRLVETSAFSYTFEKCEPNEYEYNIEFSGHLSESKGKQYEEFLLTSGYKIIKKRGSINYYLNRVTYQIDKVMLSIKSYNNKFLIIEKKNKNEKFKTNNNISDVLIHLKVIRNTYILYTILFTILLTHGFLQTEITRQRIVPIIITTTLIIIFLIKVINYIKIINNLKN